MNHYNTHRNTLIHSEWTKKQWTLMKKVWAYLGLGVCPVVDGKSMLTPTQTTGGNCPIVTHTLGCLLFFYEKINRSTTKPQELIKQVFQAQKSLPISLGIGQSYVCNLTSKDLTLVIHFNVSHIWFFLAISLSPASLFVMVELILHG